VLARAAWAFAHGTVQLEQAGRFPLGADLDAAWSKAVQALGDGSRRRPSSAGTARRRKPA
jgi:hypothetical protein